MRYYCRVFFNDKTNRTDYKKRVLAIVFDTKDKVFIVYIASISQNSDLVIYLFYKAQIVVL